MIGGTFIGGNFVVPDSVIVHAVQAIVDTALLEAVEGFWESYPYDFARTAVKPKFAYNPHRNLRITCV